MFCTKCGAKLNENSKFCTSCGAPVGDTATEPKASETIKVADKPTTSTDTLKIIKLLAYIGPLFLVGLLCGDKDDKSVKFHVGQGIMVCILDLAAGILNNLIVFSIFRTEETIFGYGTGIYTISPIGYLISGVIYIAVLVLSIIGIVNVVKGEDKELPIIGKYAFYK